MKYSTRIFAAALVSVFLNVAIWEIAARIVLASPVPDRIPEASPPLVFNFSQPEPMAPPEPVATPNEPAQLIETPRESSEPIEDTDLISDKNSKASDVEDSEGERAGPRSEEPSEFDQQGGGPSSASASKPLPPVMEASVEPQPAPEEAAEAESERPQVEPVEQQEDAAIAVAEAPGALSESEAVELDTLEKSAEEPAKEESEVEALPKPFELAQAQLEPLQFKEELESTSSREETGSEGQGFLSFEARKHEMGEYMLEVRTRVVRQWKAALLLKYHGVRRTKAVIECSIQPNGLLEYVRIKDPGSSYAFAVICQEAIRKAAPFPSFPFDVPEVYRNENMEITWSFSYM